MIGKQFGRWTVRKHSHRDESYRHYWLCDCECGESGTVDGSLLRRGKSTSCGCYKAELDRVRAVTHGHTLHRHFPAEYTTWTRLRSRCNNSNSPDYPDYGGRGIFVCPEWDEYPQFLADMGPKPGPEYSIDRIDVNGPYSPENCRWATHVEQANNRRPRRKRLLPQDDLAHSVTHGIEAF